MQESSAGCPCGRHQLPGAVTKGTVVSLLRGEGPRPVSCRCSGICLPGREAGNARPPSPNPRLVQGPPGSGALGETPGSASTCAASDDTCPPPGGASPGGEPPQGHLGSRGPEQGRPVHPPGAPALPSPSLRCLTRRAVLFGVNGRMGEPMVESLRADTQKEAREDCLGSRPPRFHPDHGGGGGQFTRLSTRRADPWLGGILKKPASLWPPRGSASARGHAQRLRPRPRPGPRAESQPRRPAAHTHPLCLVRPLCAGPREGGLEDTCRDRKRRGWSDLGAGRPWSCCCVLERESSTCGTWWGHPLGTLSAGPGRGGGVSVPGDSELAVPALRLHHGGEDLEGGRGPPRHERGVRPAPGHYGWEPPEPVHLGGQGDSAARGRRP